MVEPMDNAKASNGDDKLALLNPKVALKIAIIGGGRIGSAFAFYLARNGHHDVTIIARPYSTRFKQLKRDCGVMTIDGELAATTISDRLSEDVPYDLVLVTVLAHQVEGLLPSLRRSSAKLIHSMFQTFAPEHLQQAVGPERVALGMPFIQSNIDAEGRITVSVAQKTLTSDPKCAEIFQAAGLPAQLEGEMPLWLRCHVPLCVAFESVSVAGERRGGGASWSTARTLALGIHASFKLIKSQGYEIYPQSKAWIDWFPVPIVASMLWIMSRIKSFRVLLATGETECCALVNSMIASGEKQGILADYEAIRAMKP